MSPADAKRLQVTAGDRIRLRNTCGTYEGSVFLAELPHGNLQIHWPEGNVIIPRGVVDRRGGVPDYNARVHVEPVARN